MNTNINLRDKQGIRECIIWEVDERRDNKYCCIYLLKITTFKVWLKQHNVSPQNVNQLVYYSTMNSLTYSPHSPFCGDWLWSSCCHHEERHQRTDPVAHRGEVRTETICGGGGDVAHNVAFPTSAMQVRMMRHSLALLSRCSSGNTNMRLLTGRKKTDRGGEYTVKEWQMIQR